jgi:hypothetical protein
MLSWLLALFVLSLSRADSHRQENTVPQPTLRLFGSQLRHALLNALETRGAGLIAEAEVFARQTAADLATELDERMRLLRPRAGRLEADEVCWFPSLSPYCCVHSVCFLTRLPSDLFSYCVLSPDRPTQAEMRATELASRARRLQRHIGSVQSRADAVQRICRRFTDEVLICNAACSLCRVIMLVFISLLSLSLSLISSLF